MHLRNSLLFLGALIISSIGLLCIPPVMGYSDVLPQTSITPIIPVSVSTANPDGSIYHVVQNGQTLEMIAISYGISISELRTLNGMVEGASDIYIGQSLVIRKALPPTETPTPTPTIQPPTRTPRSTTPIITPTPLPSLTATPRPLIPEGILIKRKSLGITLISIGVAGLIAILLPQMLSKRKSQP
jgi:LysM repeat protein